MNSYINTQRNQQRDPGVKLQGAGALVAIETPDRLPPPPLFFVRAKCSSVLQD